MLEVALYFLSAEVYLCPTPTCPEFIIIRAALGECAGRNMTEGRPYLSVTPHPASIEIPGTDSCFPGARWGLSVAEHLLCSGNSSFYSGLSSYLLTELTPQGKNKILTGARNLLTIPFHCSRGTQITLAGRQGLAPVSSH